MLISVIWLRRVHILGTFLFPLLFFNFHKLRGSCSRFCLDSFLYLCLLCRGLRCLRMLLRKRLSYLQYILRMLL